MKWNEVRKAYLDKWVVLEAIEAHSENNMRILDEVAVVDFFEESMEALRRHAVLNKQKPNRGIIGYDFIKKLGLIIDLQQLSLRTNQ